MKLKIPVLDYDIQRIDSPEGRRYKVPGGHRYPSVTTFLSAIGDKSYLDEWIKRVGPKRAEQIKVQGANRGTRLHNAAERYLLEQCQPMTTNPLDRMLFMNMKPFLDSINKVYYIEPFLYSDVLQLAGACDIIGEVDGIPTVIDLKTATGEREVPSEYWIQTTCYSLMLQERTGLNIPRLCIATSADDGDFKVAFSDRKQWLQKLKIMLEKFRSHTIL